MPETIDRETLAVWLREGRPVTVVDLQPDDAFQEWHVPGSVHLPYYDALKRGEAQVVDDVALPDDRPVVTVCPRGRTSALAAERLRARGHDARSLAGGLRAWSRAWNLAELPLRDVPAQVVQVRRTGKGCLSYLIASGGEAAVLDPSLDAAVYQRLADERGLRITVVLETHVQADHLSRARDLARATGARLMLPTQDRVAFPFEPVREGDEIRIGAARLTALRTPGHTPESTSFRVGHAALFTGDTLFLDGVGRPDLDASPEQAEQRARDLHGSLRRLLDLPDDALVLPAHTARPVPFDGVPIAAPIADVRARVAGVSDDAERFVKKLMAQLPPPPENAERVLAWNAAGELPDDPDELEAGANRCASPLTGAR